VKDQSPRLLQVLGTSQVAMLDDRNCRRAVASGCDELAIVRQVSDDKPFSGQSCLVKLREMMTSVISGNNFSFSSNSV